MIPGSDDSLACLVSVCAHWASLILHQADFPVALEIYLEEVKVKLAETPLVKPKNNLPSGEQRALKELINNKEIILKKQIKAQLPSL